MTTADAAPPSDRTLHETTSLCAVCKNAVPARVSADARGEVWMHKRCATHGEQRVRVSTDAAWYERTRAIAPRPRAPVAPARPVERGCPFDCGPCESHAQDVRLPVVTITSACDLACPICYVHNKNDDAFHMTREEFARVLDRLLAGRNGELELINFTGGEPLMHPELFEFIAMSRAAGVHRVSICSNGVRLAREPELVARLAALGARVALSFDTFDRHVDQQLQGARLLDLKLRCLDLLEQHDVDTTLIPVMTRGYNDLEIGRILAMGLARRNVRHVEVHTMTFTGPGGVAFDRSGRISMVEVLERIEQTTEGLLRVGDFVPSPCAHPLCYQIAYLLVDPAGGPPVPFARFLDPATMYECLSDKLYLEPGPRLERALRDAIDALWTRGDEDPDAPRALALLESLLRRLFPPGKPLPPHEALRQGELAAKAVYVHSHMDEETFDIERAYQCCDSNCYADGSTIPVCNYNVLYREKEPRFVQRPLAWNERAGGRRSLPVLAR